ncbi:MAG: FKBP-type peptidyl-prolyl cis-trans isomerase [Pseudomonadales bacterium]
MKLFFLPVAFAGVLALSACEQKAAEPETTEKADDASAALDTQEKKVSYAMGLSLGDRFRTDGIKLDIATFTEGLTAGSNDSERLMTPEEIAETMQAFQQQQMAKMQEEQAAAGAKNAEAGEAFLAENGKKEGVVTTDSGLQYKVVTKGDGAKPKADDLVSVHYKGTLLDGKEFDSSHKRGQPAEFGVDQVIPGWTEALQLMPVGSKWELVIPADLAYGPGGAGGDIGPNSTLQFEVELLEIKDKEAVKEEAVKEEAVK